MRSVLCEEHKLTTHIIQIRIVNQNTHIVRQLVIINFDELSETQCWLTIELMEKKNKLNYSQ